MRLRLKSSSDVSSYSTANQVILNALKKYGLIVADNGSSMYLSVLPDDRWYILTCTILATFTLPTSKSSK